MDDHDEAVISEFAAADPNFEEVDPDFLAADPNFEEAGPNFMADDPSFVSEDPEYGQFPDTDFSSFAESLPIDVRAEVVIYLLDNNDGELAQAQTISSILKENARANKMKIEDRAKRDREKKNWRRLVADNRKRREIEIQVKEMEKAMRCAWCGDEMVEAGGKLDQILEWVKRELRGEAGPKGENEAASSSGKKDKQ